MHRAKHKLVKQLDDYGQAGVWPKDEGHCSGWILGVFCHGVAL